MTEPLIVAKFGGSSVGDSVAIKRSAQLACQQNARLVCVSATYGTTNTLLELADHAIKNNHDETQKLLANLIEKHQKLSTELGCIPLELEQLDRLYDELRTLAQGISLLKECSKKANDRLLSLGERLSSILFTRAYKDAANNDLIELFDVRNVMQTTSHFGKAVPLLDKLKDKAKEHFNFQNPKTCYVTQGFIGQNEDGETTTLGRGGSDYSASLLGEVVGASEIQIWTDVAGIATTDPRVCAKARSISEITFKEAAEMATFGAKVLHPTTLTPAKRAGIPVFVGSSFEPEKKGTWIKNQADKKPLIRALTKRSDQSLVTISTPKMLAAHGFLANIFRVFEKHDISVDAITTSEISVALTVHNDTFNNQKLLDDLAELGNVKVEKDLCLVSLIGNNINHTKGLANNIFKTLADINIRMICQGASVHNFCLILNESEGDKAIKALHKFFIEKGDYH